MQEVKNHFTIYTSSDPGRIYLGIFAAAFSGVGISISPERSYGTGDQLKESGGVCPFFVLVKIVASSRPLFLFGWVAPHGLTAADSVLVSSIELNKDLFCYR